MLDGTAASTELECPAHERVGTILYLPWRKSFFT
jgi:hypothetical protein